MTASSTTRPPKPQHRVFQSLQKKSSATNSQATEATPPMSQDPSSHSLLTSSRTGTFYFAFGSNLSVQQMKDRCVKSPETSSEPVAIARLDGWKWIICERGYANIVPSASRPQSESPPRPRSQSPQVRGQQKSQSPGPAGEDSGRIRPRTASPARKAGQQRGSPSPSPPVRPKSPTSEAGSATPKQGQDVVWGILYNLSAGDEELLDAHEGHSVYRNAFASPNPSTDPAEKRRKPYLQGSWDYNKLYLPVRVTRWLQPHGRYKVPQSELQTGKITALAYIDELRTNQSRPKPEYITRMNRAIRESIKLGLPADWVDKTLRPFIPEEQQGGPRSHPLPLFGPDDPRGPGLRQTRPSPSLNTQQNSPEDGKKEHRSQE